MADEREGADPKAEAVAEIGRHFGQVAPEVEERKASDGEA